MLPNELHDFVIDKLDDLKGQDITKIDVRGKSDLTDYMIICTGTSSRHVNAIAEHLILETKTVGISALGSEGHQEADWIVVDLGDVIAHIMLTESRGLYELEKLWQ